MLIATEPDFPALWGRARGEETTRFGSITFPPPRKVLLERAFEPNYLMFKLLI